jgi:heme/copper-type cytochrome/quinol oxidase subunit 4
MVEPPEQPEGHEQSTPEESESKVIEFMSGFMEVLGILFLFLCFVPLLFIAGNSLPGAWVSLTIIPSFAILGIGLVQLVYVIPRGVWLYRHGKSTKLKGLIAGAILVALLNGSCWLLLSGAIIR